MSDPKTLGRYQIETFLGKGAFAEVYKAMDTMLKRTVALKVLKPALMADEEAFVRFTREAQVLASLVHPHIAWVWDMGEADGRYFIAMRYVEGKSLEKILAERGALGWNEALKITEQVVEALEFAHGKGLVHRDVKPQNILLSEEEGAVLTDFGFVKALLSSGMTTTGSFMGTPNYMAAEIWEGKDASPASDQYALACVLVEMLTGKVLFDGTTPPAVMAKHFQPPVLPSGLPGHVVKALQNALSRLTTERYENIRAFMDSLHVAPQEPKHRPRAVAKRRTPKVPVTETGQKKTRDEERTTSNNMQQRGNQLTVTLTQGAKLAFVRVAAGEFLMGTGRSRFLNDEGPQHKVDLPEFWMGKMPVTNEQYRAFVKSTGHEEPLLWVKNKIPAGKEQHPVTDVSWDDARAFCQWASKLVGASILLQTIHLPSEAEWEKAARGTDGRKYPWGDQQPDESLCNYDNNVGDTSPVGSYSPAGDSPYGCVDMVGNVWEWTSSSYQKYPFRGNDGREDETVRNAHVLRGGSWNDDESFMGCANRSEFDPSESDCDLGFRCCCKSLQK